MNKNDLVVGMLPRHEVSIISGASGAGKTSLIFQLLADMQQNRPFLGTFGVPSPYPQVGYIAADRGGDSLDIWAEKTGVDLSVIKFRSIVTDDTIDIRKLEKESFRMLQDLISSMTPLDLIIIDPMIIFLGGDTKNYTHNAMRLIQLNRIAHLNKLTILGTHHAVKARTDYGYKRPQDRISGTGAFLGYTSTQMFLDTPEESGLDHHTFHVISHTAAGIEIPLTRTDIGTFQPSDVKEAGQIQEQILHICSQGMVPRGTVITMMSECPPRTVDFHLHRLVEEGRLRKEGFGKYRIA